MSEFDIIIDRRGSGAIKTDQLKERYGRDDLLAAWVADMDFATPNFIIDAIKKRLEHPIFGYTAEPKEYKQSIIEWEKELHDWTIQPEWISYIPGIVKGIGMVINVFSQPNDNVVIMPPVYHPFRITAELNGRKVVNIPLKTDKSGRLNIDFQAFEKEPIEGGILILSNPHNPGGRIWEKNELEKLAEIAFNKKLLVISDEIHADMCLFGKKHVPFMTVSEKAAQNSITFCAPSKTFNIPGIVSSFAVIPNEEIRSKFYNWLKANEFDEAPIFSHIATISAYTNGKEWRKKMLAYVQENINFTVDFFKNQLPEIKALIPDASFLVWLDCRGLDIPHSQIVDLFVNYAKVALNDGAMFGKEGEGFMRLNIATPLSELIKILNRIKDGVIEYRNKQNENK